MQPNVEDASFLWDMLMSAIMVTAFVEGRTLEEYERDILLKSAVERQIEIIGQAARRVSREFQNAHPEIPWQKIVAQRHVFAHELNMAKSRTIVSGAPCSICPA
jgi:uncharacterized protein with HEPN domain